MQDKLLFQFVVIADTHIRLPDYAEERVVFPQTDYRTIEQNM